MPGLVYTLTAFILATAYVPPAASPPWNATINGTACRAIPWQACPYPTGSAACNHYARGTRLLLPAWVEGYGFPREVVCLGGGGPAVDVDLALTSADVDGDLKRAAAWGRRRLAVTVILPAPGALLPARAPTRAPPRATHQQQGASHAHYPQHAARWLRLE